MTFEVLSSDGTETYLVDLLENKGNGACSCRDFICRRLPKWKETGKTVPYGWLDSSHCRHIQACIELWSIDVLKAMYDQTRKQ
jgi:hypothetical protein